MHDMGAMGVVQSIDGIEKRGFRLYVGGGLGAVPHQAHIYSKFLLIEELLPTAQAISRVFTRLGEKKNCNHARIKFLVAKLGIEEFRRLAEEERAILPDDSNWTTFLNDLSVTEEELLERGQSLNSGERIESFTEWHRTNVYKQRQ